MSGHPRESKSPAQMSRKQLEDFIVGQVDHRIAAVEERLSVLERRTTAMPSSGDGGATTEARRFKSA
jgi:hypothetical protein